jgi:hypothetical protein
LLRIGKHGIHGLVQDKRHDFVTIHGIDLASGSRKGLFADLDFVGLADIVAMTDDLQIKQPDGKDSEQDKKPH